LITSKPLNVDAMNNLFNPESRSKQTNNFRPTYSDNPNAYIDSDVSKAQAIGLNLLTENPIGAGIANAFANGVLGNGLKLESFINRSLLKGVSESEISKIQETIEAYWDVWSATPSMCDHYQKNSLAAIETMALKSIIGEGDGLLHVGIVRDGNAYYPQIQWIDGTAIETPPEKFGQKNIVSGVEIDNKGRDVAYYVRESQGNDLNVTYKRCPVKSKVRNITAFQLVKFNEIQQCVVRGRSMLIPVKDLLIQSGRYIESEVVKAIIQSYMTFFITQEKDVEEQPGKSTAEEIAEGGIVNDEGSEYEEDEDDRELGLGPGLINQLRPGENAVLPESKAPTAGFREFMETLLKLVGMAVNIPYESLLKSFNSSYSASQASLQEAARGYAIFRNEFEIKFMKTIYSAFVDCLILQGVIKCKGYEDDIYARSSWLKANWHGPAILNIDPVKNAKAANLAINANLTTREIESRKLYGNEWSSVIKRLGKEAKEIKKNLPVEEKEEDSSNNSNDSTDTDTTGGDES